MGFQIAELKLLAGQIGICPMPGREGDFPGDLAAVLAWRPDIVLTMTTEAELRAKGDGVLPKQLAAEGIAWLHLPVADFGVPAAKAAADWPAVSQQMRGVLAKGGRILVHCLGGCGRSGMAVLRIMVDAGEAADAALMRLRVVRPCAVETPEQLVWAIRAGQSQEF